MSVIELVILFLVFLGIAKLLSKRTSCNSERRSWGKVCVILGIVAVLFYVRYSRQVASVARHDADVRGRIAHQLLHHRVETDPSAQQIVDEVAQQYGGLNDQSMQAIWERLNQPRIKLEADDQGGSLEAGPGPHQVKLRADDQNGTKPIAPGSDKSPESLARSVARLDRVVEQVSTLADQVSDVGTLVGKAMIALNETIDSRPHSAAAETEQVKTPMSAPKLTVTASSSVPVVPNSAAGPAQQTIEIKFDQGKLDELGLSFDKLTQMLGNQGFWRGLAIHIVSNELRIEATGELEDDYTTKLDNTLVGTIGRLRRQVHLSDVASVSIVGETVNGHEETETRPAWVDEAPKNIGNVRRQVIVAGDFVTLEECTREADRQLLQATFNRLMELSGQSDLDRLYDVNTAGTPDLYGRVRPNPAEAAALYLNRMGIGIDYIRREIAKNEYVGSVERSVGPMKNLYTLVEFTPSVDAELRRRWDEYRRSEQFAVVGTGAGAVLSLIGLAFGLLKVDTWTRGYYTKRLFLGVPAAIIMCGLLLWADPMHLF